jgi:uncharacterized protein YggE
MLRNMKIGLALSAALALAIPAAAQEPAAPPVPMIVTTGDAVVRRAPDRAFLVAAVETRAKDPKEAQSQNAKAMTAVQARVTGSGIPKDAVRTLGYNIQQEFDFVNGRRVPRGYLARNAVEVRVDALDQLGELLDAVVQAGATSISGVRFDLRDRAGAEREALRLAVADARARAEAAASGVGRTIDRVLRIDDTRREPPRPMQMAMIARDVAPADVATPVEAGEIEIHAQATLTVSIK